MMRFYPLAQLSTLLLGAFLSQSVTAFDKGQRVWIDLPAVNINDDSYGEGLIEQDTGIAQVRVFVKSMTTSKAFSSGVFCAPSDRDPSWEMLSNQSTNETRALARSQLMDWTAGYNRYFERQNWLHTFLKWQDDHPVIERGQLVEAGNTARARNLTDLTTVSELVVASYDAYQTEHFQFYAIPERITRLTPVLQSIGKQLNASKPLQQAWQPQNRSLDAINYNSYTFFMTQAIDKVVRDAQKSRRLVIETQIDPLILKAFDQALNTLKRAP
jgi:hypothetical protein